MSRLISKRKLSKHADEDVKSEAKQLLSRIEQSSNDLKDIYYTLFNNLSALYTSYPSIYQQLEMIVKLPKNEDAMEIVAFNNDLSNAISHFKDDTYLSSYVSNSSETIDDITD